MCVCACASIVHQWDCCWHLNGKWSGAIWSSFPRICWRTRTHAHTHTNKNKNLCGRRCASNGWGEYALERIILLLLKDADRCRARPPRRHQGAQLAADCESIWGKRKILFHNGKKYTKKKQYKGEENIDINNNIKRSRSEGGPLLGHRWSGGRPTYAAFKGRVREKRVPWKTSKKKLDKKAAFLYIVWMVCCSAIYRPSLFSLLQPGGALQHHISNYHDIIK